MPAPDSRKPSLQRSQGSCRHVPHSSGQDALSAQARPCASLSRMEVTQHPQFAASLVCGSLCLQKGKCVFIKIHEDSFDNVKAPTFFSPPVGFKLTEGRVTQSPRHKITENRQAVALWCDPISGHGILYRYGQALGQGLELLIHFEDEIVSDNSQSPKNRFSAERPRGRDSTFKIQPAERGDSAVYFCASKWSDFSGTSTARPN
ncbi:hypothetical protein MC885_008793 [Smutsia gigantea]|nr:hypothetical protein MC885_008793 [Smutsia gigantea]